MRIFSELWRFLKVRKKFWLLPMIVMTVLFGGLVISGQVSVDAPFIYTLL